jgi:hypothetical protein
MIALPATGHDEALRHSNVEERASLSTTELKSSDDYHAAV